LNVKNTATDLTTFVVELSVCRRTRFYVVTCKGSFSQVITLTRILYDCEYSR